MARIANSNASIYTYKHKPFMNTNKTLYAMWHDHGDPNRERYVVYSYGDHWPLYIYTPQNGTWYENEERTSVTTSKHRSQARPSRDTKTVLMDLQTITDIADRGLVAAAARKLQGQ